MAGTATISVEIELGWGLVRFGKFDKLSDDRAVETRYLSRLLDRCDAHDVPITFNVVGHLLHEECDGDHGGPHEDGWWDVDPGTSVEEDPEFYAPDLIEEIRSRETDHEICTHTYSHVECDRVDPEVVRWELEQVHRVFEEEGLDRTVSIVPPRHSPPPPEVLRDASIRVQRVPCHRAEAGSEAATPVGKLYDILAGDHPRIDPAVRDGVVETYSPEYTTFAAPYLQIGRHDPHPVYRPLPVPVRRRLHRWNLRRGADGAVADDSFVHYWSHLYDFSNDQQWPQVEAFLAHLGARQAEGDLRVRTMRDLRSVAEAAPIDERTAAEEIALRQDE